MSSRLRKVEHIVIFDMNGEMVAGKKEEPFWFKDQKEYYFGDKKITESNYNSKSRKVRVSKNQLELLKRKINKMMEEPFCWVDVEENEQWLDINFRGGSTISYMGNDRAKFFQKVLGIEERR